MSVTMVFRMMVMRTMLVMRMLVMTTYGDDLREELR